jgi:hypothetical protein
MEGFEHCGDATSTTAEIAERLATKWDVIYADSADSFTLVSGYKSQGVCLKYAGALFAEETGKNQIVKVVDNQINWVVGFAFRQLSGMTYTAPILCGLYSYGRPTVYLSYTLQDAWQGNLVLKRASGAAICNVYLLNDVWYYIEFKATIDPTNGSGELCVDGVSIGSASGIATGYSDIVGADRLQFVNSYGSYIDDIYLLDGQTPGDTDFLGKSKVSTCFPSQDTGPNNWAASQVGDHYTMVNEPILNMSNYLYTDTDGASERFSFGTIPGSGTVYGAQLVGQFATSGSQLKTAAVTCESGSNAATLEQIVAQPDNHTDIVIPLGLDPNTGNSWERTDLSAANFGVEKIS